MKKLLLILLLACANTFCLVAQPPIEWQKSLGGTGDDFANSIQQTTDSGYVVAGFSESIDGDVTGHHGTSDCWVAKLNSTGVIQWQKSLGGTGGDDANSIRQTTDSGYIVAGYSASNDGDVTGNHGNGNYDYWIVKLNSIGTIQWQKCLGGTGDEAANSIQQTNDSGYIVAGYSLSNDSDVTGNHGSSDCWIVKLNSTGTIQWQKSLGGTGGDNANSIQQTTDSGYIVGGYSNSNDSDVTGNHGGLDYWVVKLNSTGTIQWQRSLGGTQDDLAYSIQQTNDSGYIVAGYSHSNDSDVTGNHGNEDYWMVKLASTGTIQWQKCLGGTSSDVSFANQQTTDGGYIVAGCSFSNNNDVTGNHGGVDDWVAKLNSTGTIEWQKCLGGTGFDQAYSVQQTTDGSYIVAGRSSSNNGDVTGNHGNSDYWVAKLNPAICYSDPGMNQLVCDISVTMTATLAIGYTGTWTLVSGGGTITDNTNPLTSVTALPSGPSVFQWAVTNGPCSDSASVTIQSFTPTVSDAGPNQLVGTTTATLTGNTPVAGTGIWTLESGTGIITNPSSPASGVTGLGVGANVFRWTVTNGACDSSSLVTITVDLSLSITEINNSSGITISPNPFASQATINFKDEQKQINIKIVDVIGKEIKYFNFTGKELKIEKGELREGIYFVQIKSEGKNIITMKIIIL